MKLIRIFFSVLLLLLASLFLYVRPQYAAMIKANESVFLPEDEQKLQDLYVFGSEITIDAPVTNDLTVAGANLTLNGNVSGSLFAAGGDITIRSAVNNALRVAGGNIVISGPVKGDVLVAGGNVKITNTASISGDVLFAGGKLLLEGPVQGNVSINGGDIVINSKINGNVSGEVGKLTFRDKAEIKGNVNYSSDSKAAVLPGALIAGKQSFKPIERPHNEPQGLPAAFTFGSLYNLATDIAVSLLIVTFLSLFATSVIKQAASSPLASMGTGFMFLVFWPLLSFFLLFLIWLGIASFIFYAFLILLAVFLSKVLFGWWIMVWWNKRNNKEYVLNWQAAVFGSLGMFILFLVPIIGWLALFFIFLITLGASLRYIFSGVKLQKNLKK